MTSPARTPEGQAVVQARQSRQKKASSLTASVNSSLFSATALARATRPRGLERSRPVRAKVGQVGRQKPQRMHCRTSSYSGAFSGVKLPSFFLSVIRLLLTVCEDFSGV